MAISKKLRQQVIEDSKYRCGYCRVEMRYVYAIMEVDHIIPQSQGGSDELENLWLLCPRCNMYKSDHTHGIDPVSNQSVALFNPRSQPWADHFFWSEDHATIVGKTSVGRATIQTLKLNIEETLSFRQLLVSANWYPPEDEFTS